MVLCHLLVFQEPMKTGKQELLIKFESKTYA